jgi:hypothetical protein
VERLFCEQQRSYYFSLNQYTTVGSSLGLPLHWRLLDGTIAGAGLLTFVWPTGILLATAQNFQDRQMKSFRQKHGAAESSVFPSKERPE